MGRVTQDAADFVAARWPELRRLGRLVARDPDDGEALALRALTEAVRTWRTLATEGRPTATTRRALLSRLLAAAPAPPAPPEPASLADAWLALGTGERAAYVLVDDLRLTEEEAGEVSGMPSAAFADLLTSARAQLTTAHARGERAAGRDAAPWTAQAAIAQFLDDRDGVATLDPMATVTDRLRTRRRRALMASAAVVATALAGAALVAGPGVTAPPPPTPSPRTTTAAPLPTPSLQGRQVWQWGSRGPLARDPGVVAGVIARWSGAQQVLWGADVGGERFLLLAPRDGWGGDAPLVTVLAGPAGARVEELGQKEAWSVMDDAAAFSVVHAANTPQAKLLVLGRPGVRELEWSRTVTVAPDLTLTRTWSAVPLDDGGAVIDLGGAAPALLLRADGTENPPGDLVTEEPPPASRAECPRCQVPAELREYVGGVVAEVAAATGLAPEELSASVVRSARLDPRAHDWLSQRSTEDTSTMTAHIVRVRLPSGALLQTLGFLVHDVETGSWNWYAYATNEPVTEANRFAPMSVSIGNPEGIQVGRQFFVPADSPATELEWDGDTRAEPVRLPLVKGTATVDLAEGSDGPNAVCRTYDAQGTLVSQTHLWTDQTWYGPWDTYRQLMTSGQ